MSCSRWQWWSCACDVAGVGMVLCRMAAPCCTSRRSTATHASSPCLLSWVLMSTRQWRCGLPYPDAVSSLVVCVIVGVGNVWVCDGSWFAQLGCTPLYIASQNGHVDVVSTLTSLGANVGACAGGGWTPLHIACLNGHAEIARLLVAHGASVNTAMPVSPPCLTFHALHTTTSH